MENKIKDLKNMMNAFISRNEVLSEEIKENEKAIKEMQEELVLLKEEQLKEI